MNFYIKKNSTLPKLAVEVFLDSRNTFGDSTESFSASTITFNMKDEDTNFYYIIGHPVTVSVKYNNGDSPTDSYFLEVQFTERQTSKIGSFVGEFIIENEYYTGILPIENEVRIHIIESFVDPDFCCIDDPTPIFPTQTPRPSVSAIPPIGCDDSVIASGNIGYYVVEAVVGEDTGIVSVELDSLTVPDRFLILYNDEVVADSSFVGDGLITNPDTYVPTILSTTSLPRYVWNGSQFVSDGVESVSFTDDDITTCTQDRSEANTIGNQFGVDTEYPTPSSSNCEGKVKISFNKTTANPTRIQIIGIGCNSGTVWNLERLICPTEPVTPSVTPTITPTSVTPTVTPTISVTPSTTPVYTLECEIDYIEPSGTTQLQNTINLFEPNDVGRGDESTFTYNKTVLNDIKNNDYERFSLSLPKPDGTIVPTTLKKINRRTETITKSTQGRVSEITSVTPIYTMYEVLYNDVSVGAVGIASNSMTGMYKIGEEDSVLYKSTNTLFTSSINKVNGVEDFGCGNVDDLTAENEIVYQNKNVTVRTLNSNEHYCVGVVMDVAVDAYNDIISNGGTVQEYLEYTIINLNAYYFPDFQGDFQFELVGFVEWTVDDPWDLNSGAYQQNQAIGTYYNNNHTTLLPNVEYNVIHQINTASAGSTLGISNFLGIYIDGMDISPKNVYCCWRLNVSYPYGSDKFDLFLNAHELGHAVVGLHTWDTVSNYQGSYSYFRGWAGGSTFPCNCNPCCFGDEECYTIMSYCANYYPQAADIMKFAPQRVTDAYNYASQYGQHLICNSVPEEPYFELSITETNTSAYTLNYTVEFKDCSDNEWYVYGTNFTYQDFSLLIPLSSLPFSADCYEYRVIVETTDTQCTGTNNPLSLPIVTPTMSVSSQPPNGNDPDSNINTIFVHYGNL